MKRLIASSLATIVTVAALAAAPALGQAEKKTELVALDGRSVDKMPLHHDFNSVWVIDNQNVLYRDDSRDYYLVTLKQACEPLDIRSVGFNFHPAKTWQLRANRSYEVRPAAGPRCDVGRIERLDDAKGTLLRQTSERRVW